MEDFHKVFELDAQAGVLLWKDPPKNHAEKAGTVAGYLCVGKGKNKTYWHVRAFGKTFKRSRVVFYMTHGRWPDPAVDHINGDSLDDRPGNLRECSLSQNAANSRPKARIHDLPQGVCRTKQGRFMARLMVNGKGRSLGVYETPDEAHRVYIAARGEAFHAFA